MEQPKGYKKESSNNLVCKLHKAIYGLRQAPRVCNEKLKSALIDLGFTPTKSNSSLYMQCKQEKVTYILIYVDDIIITGNDNRKINQTVKHLDKMFSIKDLGDLHYFFWS